MSHDLWSHPPLLHCFLLHFFPCNFHNFCFSVTILTSKSGQICLISALGFTVSAFSASKHQEGYSPVAVHTFTSHIIRQNPKMHWHLKLLTLSTKVTHPGLTSPLTSHSQYILVTAAICEIWSPVKFILKTDRGSKSLEKLLMLLTVAASCS